MQGLKPIPLTCIIDDDEYYVFALQRMLSIFKISESVLHFPNGKEALDYFKMVKFFPVQLPELIFLDINMPNMAGWQFLDNFSKLRPQLAKQVSIYMLSSSISMADIQRAKSYTTVAAYLVKPINKEDLLRVLEEVQQVQEKVR